MFFFFSFFSFLVLVDLFPVFNFVQETLFEKLIYREELAKFFRFSSTLGFTLRIRIKWNIKWSAGKKSIMWRFYNRFIFNQISWGVCVFFKRRRKWFDCFLRGELMLSNSTADTKVKILSLSCTRWCGWCSALRTRKRNQRAEFEFQSSLVTFTYAQITFEKSMNSSSLSEEMC